MLCEKGCFEEICGTGKQQIAEKYPREFDGCEADRKLLCEKGCFEEICGTGKQQIAEKRPQRISWLRSRQEIALRERVL